MSKPHTHPTFDEVQFEALFKSHFQYLCNFARQYVHEDETAREITQQVFIALWEKRASLNPAQSVKAYLFTAVKNRCLNYLRDSKKYRSKLLDIDCGNFELSREEDHFAEAELKAQIEAVLNSLPEKCRQVFEMSRFEEMKYKDIARELGISQKTVEAHISKALKSLREQLQHFLLLFLAILEYFFHHT
ncbi:MAG: RNA polymerase sigma-70 factor [Bacteroidetes bacterium]|nr:MAG: RNA polymerase sigma-70 factor [Bacteroidota bacterium]